MTLPATDGIAERLQALLAYDSTSPLIFSRTRLYLGVSIFRPTPFSGFRIPVKVSKKG